MPFEKHYDQPEPIAHTPCIHIRSKGIYVTGELRVPEHADEEACQHCWCNITQHVMGPDKIDVGLRECAPTRDCYRQSH